MNQIEIQVKFLNNTLSRSSLGHDRELDGKAITSARWVLEELSKQQTADSDGIPTGFKPSTPTELLQINKLFWPHAEMIAGKAHDSNSPTDRREAVTTFRFMLSGVVETAREFGVNV